MADEVVLGAVGAQVESSMYAMMHPGSITSGSHYAHQESSTLEANVLQVRQGTLKIPTTSLSLQSTATFQVPNRELQGPVCLVGSITIPRYILGKACWLYDIINQITISTPGVNNIQYSGVSLRDALFRSITSFQRDAMEQLMPMVDSSAATYSYDFVCPLYLPWSHGLDPNTGFFLEAGVIASNYILQIQWNPITQVLYTETPAAPHTPVYPTAFDRLELKPIWTAVSLSPALTISQKDMYSIPSFGIQSYDLYGITSAANVESSILLQSLPTGQIVSIFVTAYDTATIGVPAGTTFANPVPIEFTYLRLNYNGLDLLELETKEIIAMGLYNSINGSDGYAYNVVNAASNTVTTKTDYPTRLTSLEFSGVDVSAAYSKHDFFMARNFQGQIFNLFWKTASSATTLDFHITYMFNRVYMFQDGQMSLHD